MRHCGKPKGPKAEDVLFLCVSMRMCCIFLYYWYCDGSVYFLIVIAKLSLLGLKDSQLFVNLSSSLWIHPFLNVAVFCASYHAQLERLGGSSRKRRSLHETVDIEHGICLECPVEPNSFPRSGFFGASGNRPGWETFLKGGKNLPCLNCAFVGEHHKSLKGFGFSMGLNFHDIINPSLIDLTY